MDTAGPWGTDDFEKLSWHDVHVHGFRFDKFNRDKGSADLVLDIDYILRWEESDGRFMFTVCQAELRFYDAYGLKLDIDYATPTAGMCPFSIDGIERELLTFPTGYKSYRWRLPVNWPKGHLEFEAPGFTQTLTGIPYLQSSQSLEPEKRRVSVAA